MVCSKCYEPRHPQTLIKAPPREQVPSWTRSGTTDIFLDTSSVLTTELIEPLLTEDELPIYTEG